MNLISVTEYAKKHNISRQSALKRIKNGKVVAKKVGSTFVVVEK